MELIDLARKQNVGVDGYAQQMYAIEDKAGAGASEAELRPLVEGLTARLDEQLKQTALMKNYKPIPVPHRHPSFGTPSGWSGNGRDIATERRANQEEQYRSRGAESWGKHNGVQHAPERQFDAAYRTEMESAHEHANEEGWGHHNDKPTVSPFQVSNYSPIISDDATVRQSSAISKQRSDAGYRAWLDQREAMGARGVRLNGISSPPPQH